MAVDHAGHRFTNEIKIRKFNLQMDKSSIRNEIEIACYLHEYRPRNSLVIDRPDCLVGLLIALITA